MPAGATDETGAGGKEDVPTEAEVVSIKSSEVMPTPVGSAPVGSAAHRHRVAVASEAATERHRAGRYGRCANR